jgi:peptidoglycan/LPS O-acetylase OafA/YrhL
MGVIRLLLALVVVIDHWIVLSKQQGFDSDSFKLGFNGGYAVVFFFIVSGFLVTYGLRYKYANDTAGFYRGRFIRIYSLYWPLVLFTLLFVPDAWSTFVQSGVIDTFTSLFLFGIDWRVAFGSYPDPHWQAAIYALGLAWTLGTELTFYVAVPFLMRSWKVAVGVLILSFSFRAFVVLNDWRDVWSYQMPLSNFGFFMLGHLVCRFGDRLARPVTGWALLVASVAVMELGARAGFDSPRLWESALLFTFCLPGLFAATKDTKWMNVAGDLSYPLYLVHMVVFYLIGEPLVADLIKALGMGAVAVYVAVTVMAALAAHYLFEEPLAQGMRKVLGHRLLAGFLRA